MAAANAIQVIDHVHAGGPIVGGRVRESHAALNVRAMRARRPAGRGALSVTGESILAQSVQVAPAPRADYAFFAFAKARGDLSASLHAL
jgi:hypothetical protein